MPDELPLDVTIERGRTGPGSLTIRVRRASGKKEVYHAVTDAPCDVQAVIRSGEEELAKADRERLELNRRRIQRGQFRRRRWGPGGIRVHETRARITYYWFSWLMLLGPPLVFAGLWASGRAFLRPDAVALVIGLPIFVVLLAILYAFVAHLINRTIIEIGSRKLSLRHGPLPWPGQLVLRNAEQLHCTYSRSSRAGMQYILCAITTEGKHITLLRELRDSAEALYLERQIEERLGIEDWPALSDLVRETPGQQVDENWAP